MGHVSILLDEMGLDKMGLDEMGINPANYKIFYQGTCNGYNCSILL